MVKLQLITIVKLFSIMIDNAAIGNALSRQLIFKTAE